MGKKWRHGIVLDAGSSGTRLYVYRWEDARQSGRHTPQARPNTLPSLFLQKTEKTRPGISSFAHNPADIGPAHLQSLVDVAVHQVPAHHAAETPIYFMATAGMRLLPEPQQAALLDQICRFFKHDTPFFVGDCASHVQVISGETEGLYGWVAANYLLAGFDEANDEDHGNGHHTIGFLDMGGASAQIAFAPNTTEAEKHSDDLQLVRMRTLDGHALEYRVFVATWLGFGANQARQRYIQTLLARYPHGPGSSLPDPCMPRGLVTTIVGEPVMDTASALHDHPTDVLLLGTGNFQQCLRDAYPLLAKDAPCDDDPCLFGGKHVPAIDFDVNHFVGVSEFWHTTHGVFGKSKAYDLQTYEAKVTNFCGRAWVDIEKDISRKSSDEKARNAQEACFKAAWLISVLYDGIGIPRPGLDRPAATWNVSKTSLEKAKDTGFLETFKPVDKIDGVDVSWTLGKMVLYASGEIPPAGPDLPVGHGSNNVAAAHFEEAGSSWRPMGLAGASIDSSNLKSPTIIVSSLILIALVLAFCLRRRERWARLSNFGRTCVGRYKRHQGGRKSGVGSFSFIWTLLGRDPGVTYERILEDGGVDQWEMQAVESGEFFGSGNGSSPRGDQPAGHWPALKSAATATSETDRSGLAVRTESRERLESTVQMLNAGRRSRGASPTRLQSPRLKRLDDAG